MSSMHCYAATDPSGAMRIVLPMPSPSLNEFNGRKWFKKNALRATWLKAIVAVAGRDHVTPGCPCSVSIERHAPRMLDTDNSYGGVKPILDAIVSLGLIVDDAPRWCTLVVTQHKTAKGEPPHTVIIIEKGPGLPRDRREMEIRSTARVET